MIKGFNFKTYRKILAGLKSFEIMQRNLGNYITKKNGSSRIAEYWKGNSVTYNAQVKDNNSLYFVQEADEFKVQSDSLKFNVHRIKPQFNSDGTILIVVLVNPGIKVIRYNLSIPYDLSTAIEDTSAFIDITTLFLDTYHRVGLGFTVSGDGNHLFFTHNSLTGGGSIVQVDLSAPYDLSAPTVKVEKFSYSATLTGIDVSPDGTKIVFTDQANPDRSFGIIEMTTPNDISTATLNPLNTYGVAFPFNPIFLENGKKIILFSNSFREYSLSTAYDLSGVVTLGATEQRTLDGIYLSPDNKFTFSTDGRYFFTANTNFLPGGEAETTLHKYKVATPNSISQSPFLKNEYSLYLGEVPVKFS